MYKKCPSKGKVVHIKGGLPERYILMELFDNTENALERVKQFTIGTLTPLEHALVIGAVDVEKLSNLN